MAVLAPLGISADAERLYLALADAEWLNVEGLAGLTGLPPDACRAELLALAEAGLAATSRDAWRALPLAPALERLRARRVAELDLAVAAADALSSQLAASAAPGTGGVTTVVGQEALIATRNALCDATKESICAFDSPPYANQLVTAEAIQAVSPEFAMLERGVVMRTVYQPGFDAGRMESLQTFVAAGEQARIATVPLKLIIFDRRVALIPSIRSYATDLPRASVVRDELLVESLVRLFEQTWEQAVPLTDVAPTPSRTGLVPLLMAGSTDAATAARLGVTERTVRRWVAELMEQHGVRTRLQLGAALVSRSLAEPSD